MTESLAAWWTKSLAVDTEVPVRGAAGLSDHVWTCEGIAALLD